MTTEDGTARGAQAEPAGSAPAGPVLRVVRGEPAADELAVLLTVLATRSGAAAAAPDERPSSWAAYWRGHRQPIRPDTDGWRASSRPR